MSIVPTIIHSDEKKNADLNIVIFHVHCGVEVLFYPNTAAASPQENKEGKRHSNGGDVHHFPVCCTTQKGRVTEGRTKHIHTCTHARTHAHTQVPLASSRSVLALSAGYVITITLLLRVVAICLNNASPHLCLYLVAAPLPRARF